MKNKSNQESNQLKHSSKKKIILGYASDYRNVLLVLLLKLLLLKLGLQLGRNDKKKHRIDDALEAVRSAQEEGILPGGGKGLINAVKGIEVETDNNDQATGAAIVIKAVEEPLRQMAKNCGLSPDIVVATVRDLPDNHGIDFMTGTLLTLSTMVSLTLPRLHDVLFKMLCCR